MLGLLLVLSLLSLSQAFLRHPLAKLTARTRLSSQQQLDIGEFNADFKQIDSASIDIGKFRLQATIKSKELNSYLEEYKAELKKRKVSFPGFRPGNVITRLLYTKSELLILPIRYHRLQCRMCESTLSALV